MTLGILWQMRRAGTHPSVYRISVIVNLAVEKAQGAAEVKRLTLLYLPVPLGLQERADRIIFDLPDMLWLDELSDRDFVGNLIRLSDLPRYDRQTDLCRVLEAALRRALWGGRSDNKNPGYRGFGNYLAKELLRWQRQPYPQDLAERAEWHLANRYTRRFENRIGYNLRLPGSGPDELVRFSDISAECTVEASPKLQHNMVMMNRRLADPGMLSAPFLVHFDERLDEDERITRDLPEAAEERTANLDEWGIVPPGQSVAPGQVLVGIVSPTADEEITPEERLLRAIFGEKVNPVRDRSLLMTGQRPGRVLTQRLDLLVGQGDGIPSIPGRLVERVGDSRVRITVVVDQPLEAGDVLVGESGATGVICGVTSGAALQRAAGTANVPDLVVAPGHPWAPQPGRAGSHAVRIRLKHDELLGRMVTSRAAGQYALVSQMPVWVNSQDFAQSLEAGDFRWLITHQAYELAMELYGPRCDCVDWRLQFHETLLRADRAPKATGDQTRGVVVAT